MIDIIMVHFFLCIFGRRKIWKKSCWTYGSSSGIRDLEPSIWTFLRLLQDKYSPSILSTGDVSPISDWFFLSFHMEFCTPKPLIPGSLPVFRCGEDPLGFSVRPVLITPYLTCSSTKSINIIALLQFPIIKWWPYMLQDSLIQQFARN